MRRGGVVKYTRNIKNAQASHMRYVWRLAVARQPTSPLQCVRPATLRDNHGRQLRSTAPREKRDPRPRWPGSPTLDGLLLLLCQERIRRVLSRRDATLAGVWPAVGDAHAAPALRSSAHLIAPRAAAQCSG